MTVNSARPAPKRITVSAVKSLRRNTTLWDKDLKGFCIRRQKGDHVSYQVKTRVSGRIRWFTIGRHGQPWTPETARKEALKILADPKAAFQDDGLKEVPFPQFAEEFLNLHGSKLKPRSLEEYQRLTRLYLLPEFRKFAVGDIDAARVSRAHAKWKDSPRSANHAIAVLSKMMSWAETHGYRPDGSNPCRKVQRYKENRRERYLQPDELTRLGSALVEAERVNILGPYPIAAIRLLLFTGARLNEILTLKWSYVDLSRRALFLPDSKTGRKTILLNDPAIAVLKQLPRLDDNPYVIVGHRSGAHMINLQKPWRRIRAAAGLDDVRLHDLRHTFASFAVATGGTLPFIGHQLGHAQPQTTQRYAHLGEDPVRKMLETTGEALVRALNMPAA